ncbi:MAG: tetraacyldisaccharide 4'-kinase [Gammaproteobacteria bacterium]|nr:tetraacyldisaccharide 4'-kinase [Gammaproteobacteria bacterium]
MSQRMIKAWYQSAWWLWFLWPLSILYRVIRRLLVAATTTPQTNPLPLLVVGNISLGGTGKTPVVQALVHQLHRQGIRCGIISRGYGGQVGKGPHLVTERDNADWVGDEPLLLTMSTDAPVVVGSDRQAAMKLLVEQFDLDMLISDDGLQNTKIKGDCEWLLIDGQRGLGNGQCLPMGPLREPKQRLHEVDAILTTAALTDQAATTLPVTSTPTYSLRPHLVALKRVFDDQDVSWPTSGSKVNALAGIGNPERFFADLQTQGLLVEGKAFTDHHRFKDEDLAPFRDTTLIMTAKDRVKCKSLTSSQDQHWLYTEQGLELPESVIEALLNKLHLYGTKKHHG